MDTHLVSHCPHCRGPVRVREAQFGQSVRCPGCREPFVVASIETAFSAGASLADAPAAVETIVSSGSVATVPETPPATPGASSRARLGRLGRFELSRLLGQGAFGRVFQAYDPQLERYVALKVPTFSPGDQQKSRRFLAEAKAAARLRHPNIVPTYESGQIDGQYYIAAQFVPGQTLSQRLKQQPPDMRQAAEWVRQLAEALAYAHGEGIVHRDIKPDNIMIDEKGLPQIMDFGLAKRLNDDAAMTTDGSILGTPAYMAPEQARGNQGLVGPHSDQYSLGVVLYELLTGERPFSGPPHAVIEQLLAKEPLRPRALRREIPRDLEAICQRAMTKEAGRRYAATGDLAADLGSFLRGDATQARPISIVERASRWRRRNPVVAALSGAIGLVVLLGVGGISVALWKAEAARRVAESNEARANREAKKAQDAQAESERSRQAAEASRREAETQRQVAENQARLASQREAEAQAARRQAVETAAELARTVARLDVATGAAEKATEQTAELEKSKTELEAKIAEQSAELKEQPEQQYRDRLQRASLALDAMDPDAAKQELLACPRILRAWEWHYLMARAKGSPRVQYEAKDGDFPSLLRYSDDGEFVLAGYRYGPNTVFNVADRTSKNLKLAQFQPDGCVCELSGQQALIMNNGYTAGYASAWLHSWRTDKPGRELPRVVGYALDCRHSLGRWLVLTSFVDPAGDELHASLMLHNYAPAKNVFGSQVAFPPPDFIDRGLCGACFDESGQNVHVFLQRADYLRWYSVELRSGKPESPKLLLEIPGSFRSRREQVLDPQWRPHVSDGLHFVVHERDGAKSHVVFGQRERADLGATVRGSAARFDPQGKRLFVVRADEGELQIFDPIPPHPAPPLLRIPLPKVPAESNRTFPTLAFSPKGQKLAVALNGRLTFFDASDGE